MVVRGGKGDHLKSKLHPTICDVFKQIILTSRNRSDEALI